MRAGVSLLRREHRFAVVIGLMDGILSALTLAAGRVVASPGAISVTLALQISAATSLAGTLVFFTAEYARVRGELAHAERQLNLTSKGHLATTRLGRAVLRETAAAAAISSGCNFLGALLPLLSGAVLPGPSWMAIAAAMVALGLLGAAVAHTVHGSPGRWAAVLMIAGGVLSYVGLKLRIV